MIRELSDFSAMIICTRPLQYLGAGEYNSRKWLGFIDLIANTSIDTRRLQK